MKKSLLLLLIAVPFLAKSQAPPASTTIHVNNVKALVQADGSLFTDGTQGLFIPVEPGLPEISLLRSAGIWISGQDTAGNFTGAAYTTSASDFETGILDELGLPYADLNKIWRINCADIDQFKTDFGDNGLLDSPNSAVLAWPSKNNPFFDPLNAPLVLPFSTPQGLAGFFDNDDDGAYDPSRGDYPSVEIRGCPLDKTPTDQSWFAFRDRDLVHPSGMQSVGMEVQVQLFAYKSTPLSPLNNTIFARYKLINRASERIDSCFFGAYMDFSIGNPNDDYAGLDLERSMIYAYNGDPDDENGFGAEAPVMGLKLFRGPLDTFGTPIGLSHFVVLDGTEMFWPASFHRVLRGSFPDGTLAPNNGLMYPGNPNDPNGQSELEEANTPGHRIGVASFGPFTLKPGAVNELIVAYSYAWTPGATAAENVQTLLDGNAALQALFDNCFEDLDAECTELVDSPEPFVLPQSLALFPNPATGTCTLDSKKAPLGTIVVTDMLGRVIRRIETNAAQYELNVENLPAGIYGIQTAGQVKVLSVQR